MGALDCKGKPLVVYHGTGEHRSRGTGFLVGTRVLMGVEHMVPQTPGFICGYRARVGGQWYHVEQVAVWSERGEDDRRGIDLATATLSADAPGHIFRFAPESSSVGTKVTVLGHPLGGPLRASEGTVTKERLDYGKPTLAARFSPDVQGGDSGSPGLNSRGEVVSVLSRIITTANLTSDGRHHYGGIDLPAWCGPDISSDLCAAYPNGGIPGCDGTTTGKAVKVIVPVSLK
jgi:V8-like Glu-specific endopeptidase